MKIVLVSKKKKKIATFRKTYSKIIKKIEKKFFVLKSFSEFGLPA